ncbi:hypothetical protein [Hymenobacter psychrotolerans]|uniref:Phospholipase_D-nuclease N-terminal n=1 Tax=Hymenobacter psychrotolerans DSM 18569 TaxID=1121959 RepID=A0A1M6Y7Q1_9BACT|nr:hypothetical protein [Hymenobacter psychrotolerans]SHL14045.1 hypothetical protein SAMN02746009_02211 [Hymenobacter psychrotolerans DSM 18569]
MDEFAFAVGLFLVASFSALVTAYIAHMHGRPLLRWLLIGFCLPLLGIFVAMALSVRDARREEAAEEEQKRR